jgi:hypothetical protein
LANNNSRKIFIQSGSAWRDAASAKLAERLTKEAGGDLKSAVDLGYRLALGRPPAPGEKDRSLSYIQDDPARLKGIAWLLYNLDEFLYIR